MEIDWIEQGAQKIEEIFIVPGDLMIWYDMIWYDLLLGSNTQLTKWNNHEKLENFEEIGPSPISQEPVQEGFSNHPLV